MLNKHLWLKMIYYLKLVNTNSIKLIKLEIYSEWNISRNNKFEENTHLKEPNL